MWRVLNSEFYRSAEFCGDPAAPTSVESTAEMMKAYTQYLPDLAKATAAQVLPTGEAQLAAQEVLSPREAALTTKLYEQFGPQINKIGSDIAADNAKRQSESDLNILQTTGPQVVSAARTAQEAADPEYFKARAGALDQLSRLFGSLDNPNTGLSGAERAEIDRTLARGNAARGIESPTATSTVENAMAFGQAGEARKQAKQAAIGQAVNVATQFMPAAKSNIDAFQMTTGKPSVTNTGEARLGGASQAGNQAFVMGNQMWGGLTDLKGQEMQINSQRRDGLDRAMQITSTVGQAAGSMMPCCYTLLEAYLGTLPWWVRACRDRFITP